MAARRYGDLQNSAQLNYPSENEARKFGLIFVLFLCLFSGEAAGARKLEPVDTFERVTEWVPLSKSMTELLNEGWRIVGINDYETEMFSDNIASCSFILTSGNNTRSVFWSIPR